MWICEKKEGVILARQLLPGAVLQELWYKIMCFEALEACFNKSLLLLLGSSRNVSLSLRSLLPETFEGCGAQPTI